ncbi:DUF1828 domain-containing protein [Butyricicoccus sp.]|uniref:DUF1828 domain-containing protein n=1 Tax=Butyricicoccus sp. TaxID=2049021 RepID=UPI003F192390
MDIQKMINDYTDWLNRGFTAIKIGEYYELTTPYLDRYNDHLQIYVKQEANGSYLLTDDGDIITNLKSAGISISRSPKRKDMLARIARNFGVSINGSALEIQATKSNYPQKKHMLLQAMMTIDDMFIAEPNNIKSFFAEDVGLFLDSQGIYYSRDFSLVGKTGSLYVYDYHLQRTKTKPERFCKAINHVSENSRNLALFNWVDTKERRTDASQLILFLNDEKGIKDSDLEAFQSYDVNCILWSERNHSDNIALLA